MNTSKFLIALGIMICLVLSPVIALVLPNTAQAQPPDSPWPMFGRNPQHSGRTFYSGPEVAYFEWSFTTGDWVFSSPAIGAGGTIYVGSGDHNLYAIGPNGDEKWRFTTGDAIASSPAIGTDGTIYVGSHDHRLYAINPDGSEKWSFPTQGEVFSSPAIGADGTIYVGSYDHRLYAINPNGGKKWSFTTGDAVASSPAIGVDGTIYVGSCDNRTYAINPNGSKKWSFPTGSDVYSSPAIGADGTIYVGSCDNNLYAINPSGSQKWSFPTGSDVYSSPAVGADGTIYVASYDDNRLYAIYLNGSEKWRFTTEGYGYGESSPAIGADGTIYVASYSGLLFAITPDGGEKWTFTTGDSSYGHSSPAIAADGTIYVGCYDHKLYAIGDGYDLIISSTPGGSVIIPGEGISKHAGGAVCGLNATAATGYRFANWTGDVGTIADVNAASTTITMNGDYSVMANFEELAEYDLTTSSNTGGSVTVPGEGVFTYYDGTVVSLVASPASGYRFVNWTGNVESVGNVNAASTTITLNGDYSITANFMTQCDLTISSTQGGSVTTPGEGTFTRDAGTVINLVAIPTTGYRFASWTGDVDTVANVSAASTTITLNGGCSITADFMAQYDLTIYSTGGGSVSAPGIGSFAYDPGTRVDLVAQAEEGYRFINWTGDVAAIANVNAAQTTITMNDEYYITAHFGKGVNWALLGGTAGALVVAGLVVFFIRRKRSARTELP